MGVEGCGFKRWGTRWDYCRFADEGKLDDGSVVVNNTALAAFVPNLSKPPKLSSRNPWTPGSWMDGQKGVAVARPKLFSNSQCFPGVPVETLGGCAIKCLQDGAPNAKTLEGEEETRHPCKALAYNRQ